MSTNFPPVPTAALAARHIWLVLTISALCGPLAGLAAGDESTRPLKRFEISDKAMGTRVSIAVYAPSRKLAATASNAALARIAELEDRLSDYREDSELMQLCATAGQGRARPVSDDLWRIVALSAAYYDVSNGAFDITAGPAIRLWRRARETGTLPDQRAIEQAKRVTGFQHVRRFAAGRKIELVRSGMQLDLGGIGKGFAADEALLAMRRAGVTQAMVDLGGDIAVGDPPPGRNGWRIAVAGLAAGHNHPVEVANRGVATSGDTFQHVVINGIRYSHLIDPRTGWATTIPTRATVIAESATAADALASALSVITKDAVAGVVASFRGAEVELAWQADDRVRRWSNAAWNRRVTRRGVDGRD